MVLAMAPGILVAQGRLRGLPWASILIVYSLYGKKYDTSSGFITDVYIPMC